MKENSEKANVFVVDTTFQLLNAVEAVNSLGLSNNHLIIIGRGWGRDRFEPLIRKKDWVSVHHIPLQFVAPRWGFRIFGRRVVEKVLPYQYDYQQFLHRRRLDKIAKSLKEVANIFLGHYWADHKPFMRHFANMLKHKTLYLLDDGTDTIDINNRRKTIDRFGWETPSLTLMRDKSLLQKAKDHIRKNYIEWNTREAESVTFFTTYPLDVRDGDQLVKNEYRYLRSLAETATRIDEVYFLGDCLFDDGYMNEDLLLKYLQNVKAYFKKEKLRYVPHPRESLRMIEKIRESLGFEIKQFGVPIEYEIVGRGHIPKVLASFCSSALESCSNILGEKIRIAAFYLYPEHLKRQQDIIEGIYKYYQKKVNPNFEIVKLRIDDLTL